MAKTTRITAAQFEAANQVVNQYREQCARDEHEASEAALAAKRAAAAAFAECRTEHEQALTEAFAAHRAEPSTAALKRICKVVADAKKAAAGVKGVNGKPGTVVFETVPAGPEQCVSIHRPVAAAWGVATSGLQLSGDGARRHPTQTRLHQAIEANDTESWSSALESVSGYLNCHVISGGRLVRYKTSTNGKLVYTPWLRAECAAVYDTIDSYERESRLRRSQTAMSVPSVPRSVV